MALRTTIVVVVQRVIRQIREAQLPLLKPLVQNLRYFPPYFQRPGDYSLSGKKQLKKEIDVNL